MFFKLSQGKYKSTWLWWHLYLGRLYILSDNVLQVMCTKCRQVEIKLLDHGGIRTQVDYIYWMMFSKWCLHQTSRKLLDHDGIYTQVDYIIYWMMFSKWCPHQPSRKLLDHAGTLINLPISFNGYSNAPLKKNARNRGCTVTRWIINVEKKWSLTDDATRRDNVTAMRKKISPAFGEDAPWSKNLQIMQVRLVVFKITLKWYGSEHNFPH